MPRVIVTAGYFKGDNEGRRKLVAAGFEVHDAPHRRLASEEDVVQVLTGYDAVVAGVEPYTAAVLEQLRSLRAIARWGVGVDNIDLQAATRLGILVTNTPGLLVDAVADMAFALMLAIARRVCEGDRRVRSGRSDAVRGSLVWGKTLGIVGVGSIGTAVAMRARGFDMTVLGYDPRPRPEAEALGVRYVQLDELLQKSDFVTLHAALTPGTEGLIGQRELAMMKPSAFLINTGRGRLVDQQALYQALKQRRIAGAALDVLAEEPPPPDEPLLQLDNCIFTPHSASNEHETVARINNQVAENLLQSFSGRTPDFCVNPPSA